MFGLLGLHHPGIGALQLTGARLGSSQVQVQLVPLSVGVAGLAFPGLQRLDVGAVSELTQFAVQHAGGVDPIL